MDIRLAAGLGLACLLGLAPAAAAAARHGHHHRTQHGLASYYRRSHIGAKTASGAPARDGKFTAASKTLPLGTKAKVTNVETGKSVRVTVTDRGPYKKGRIVDVSPKAADKLGLKDDGVAPVKVTPLQVPTNR